MVAAPIQDDGGSSYQQQAPPPITEEIVLDDHIIDENEEEKKATRKGKWTIEEEEFTTRIIEFFNSGLLELPDGTTLRSYLAEKLNCDPMRITKKFSGQSSLGKRIFHSSSGRQREERMNRTASSQTLAAAQRELSMLESRFIEAVNRSTESKDARMIDLEARFLHSSNVVSTPAIDAFIMQSCCGGALWDPDNVASKGSDKDQISSAQQALQQATATHLAIDPSAYAEGAMIDPNNNLIHVSTCNTENLSNTENHIQSYTYLPHPQYLQQQHYMPPQEPGTYYIQDPYGYQIVQHPPQQQEANNRETQFQHLVRQQHDPNFLNATRVSHDQHQADQVRISRWMAATKASSNENQNNTKNKTNYESNQQDGGVDHTSDAPPLPFPAPPPPPIATVAKSHNPNQHAPAPSIQESKPPVSVSTINHGASSHKQNNNNSEAVAGGLLLGFVKSLHRSNSHNELVDFVEDVNEKVADSRKRSASQSEAANSRKRQALNT